MISLIFLYDEYIDRPKLSGQKNPVEYIVHHPTSEVGTKTTRHHLKTLTDSDKQIDCQSL